MTQTAVLTSYSCHSDIKELYKMSQLFAETLKKLRREKGLNQRQLAERLYVTRSSVNRWENGSRLPDAAMLFRLSEVLGVDINLLFAVAAESDSSPNVIMLDDNKIVLNGGLAILEDVIPTASVTGFTKPADALAYAKANRVSLAFLDIEMGRVSGLDVCRELLNINPRINVVFLTAYPTYAFDAWETGASGFMLKPITAQAVQDQLKKLRYPFPLGGDDA